MAETLKDKKKAEFLQKIKDAIHETADKTDWDWEDEEDGKTVLLTWEDEEYEMDATKGIPKLSYELEDYYENYDPDYEASLWIGEDGHGKNGAPYHIKDIVTKFEDVDEAYEKLKIEFQRLRWDRGCDLDPDLLEDGEEE